MGTAKRRSFFYEFFQGAFYEMAGSPTFNEFIEQQAIRGTQTDASDRP